MKYNHALFLNPYTAGAESGTGVRGLFPPTGLEYVATSAKDFVGKVTLLDLMHEKDLSDTNKLLDFISKEIDIVCVSIGWNRQFEEICDILNLMPDNIPLVVGGYKATEVVEELFKICPKIDIIVRGEGEETIKKILQGMQLENILGISYRTGDRIIHNANRPLQNVDIIAPPDRTLRRVKYSMKLKDVCVTRLTFDTILSARGCPYNCKFCTFSSNPLGQKRCYSARNVESVIKEIEGIAADAILFSDNNFFADIKRLEEICDLLIERKIKKRFIAQCRIEIAKYPKVLEKVVKAGFKMLLIGIESPHDHILAQLNKGFDAATIRKSFEVLRKYPLYYHGFFIYGNIGETEKEMLYISKFAKEIGVDSVSYSRLRVDKFTPLRKIVEETPEYHIGVRGALYSDTYDQAALKKIGKNIKFSFYTPSNMLKLGIKAFKVRLLTFGEIMSFIIASPLLLKNVIAREIQKGRLGDSLKRMFIKKHSSI
jgi:radical SAM superfamily enzyme YgiQ (UPF0313 family)